MFRKRACNQLDTQIRDPHLGLTRTASCAASPCDTGTSTGGNIRNSSMFQWRLSSYISQLHKSY
jgi:hypothetical protein